MSNTKITQKYIFDIARSKDVDKNQNGKIEGDEVSIFENRLQEKGITNPQLYINEFNNSKKSQNVDVVNKLIKDGFSVWGWTDFDDLDKGIEQINSGNVLEVLESYDDGDSLIKRLDDELFFGQDKLTEYGNIIIDALLGVAKERNIDVSDIVAKADGKGYIVGPSVTDADTDELATDSDNLDLVVTALRNRIESHTELMTNQDAAKEDPKNAMLVIARQVDSKGNGDGAINGEEVAEFKAACSKVGIVINDILSSIFKKTESEEDLTDNEEFVKNIFSGSYAQISNEITNITNQSEGITKAIKDKDEEELRNYINADTVNANNVESLLSKLDDNDDFMKLPVSSHISLTGGMSYIKYSENNDIGQKLVKAFGDDAKEFTEVILKALCDKAEQNDIDISDIVTVSNNKFFTPEGEYALDSKYVNKVIESVRNRINEKLDK